MSGEVAVESWKEGSIANGIGSTKRLPMESATKLVTAGTSWRGGREGGRWEGRKDEGWCGMMVKGGSGRIGG